jgi:hypothetical protein
MLVKCKKTKLLSPPTNHGNHQIAPKGEHFQSNKFGGILCLCALAQEEKLNMPPNHGNTKLHQKEQTFYQESLVGFCAFVLPPDINKLQQWRAGLWQEDKTKYATKSPKRQIAPKGDNTLSDNFSGILCLCALVAKKRTTMAGRFVARRQN